MTTATVNSVLRAFNKCAKRICDEGLTSAATSAGFIIPNGQKRGHRSGWQVFVKMISYSDAKLKKDRNGGGLAVKAMSRYVLLSEFRPHTAVLEWKIVDTKSDMVVATVHVFDGTAQWITDFLNANNPTTKAPQHGAGFPVPEHLPGQNQSGNLSPA